MNTERGELWKELLRTNGILKGTDLASGGTSVEFRFAGDANPYALDPSSGRVTATDDGPWLIFHFHGKHPIYHLWSDLSSITIRT